MRSTCSLLKAERAVGGTHVDPGQSGGAVLVADWDELLRESMIAIVAGVPYGSGG